MTSDSHTLCHSRRLVLPVRVARQEIVDLDPTLEFLLKQVILIHKYYTKFQNVGLRNRVDPWVREVS